jgi:hypothetical protein
MKDMPKNTVEKPPPEAFLGYFFKKHIVLQGEGHLGPCVKLYLLRPFLIEAEKKGYFSLFAWVDYSRNRGKPCNVI